MIPPPLSSGWGVGGGWGVSLCPDWLVAGGLRMRWAFSPCGPTRLADHLTGNHLEQLDLDPRGGVMAPFNGLIITITTHRCTVIYGCLQQGRFEFSCRPPHPPKKINKSEYLGEKVSEVSLLRRSKHSVSDNLVSSARGEKA